jgi:transcriptional regulator with XRE-family HTH domain
MATPRQDALVWRLGRVIASRRVALGISQALLAERLGLGSAETISRYERGEREPRFTTLVRLATALETSMSELMRDVEASTRHVAPDSTTDALTTGPEEVDYLVSSPSLVELAKVLERLDPHSARIACFAIRGIVNGLKPPV